VFVKRVAFTKETPMGGRLLGLPLGKIAALGKGGERVVSFRDPARNRGKKKRKSFRTRKVEKKFFVKMLKAKGQRSHNNKDREMQVECKFSDCAKKKEDSYETGTGWNLLNEEGARERIRTSAREKKKICDYRGAKSLGGG